VSPALASNVFGATLGKSRESLITHASCLSRRASILPDIACVRIAGSEACVTFLLREISILCRNDASLRVIGVEVISCEHIGAAVDFRRPQWIFDNISSWGGSIARTSQPQLGQQQARKTRAARRPCAGESDEAWKLQVQTRRRF